MSFAYLQWTDFLLNMNVITQSLFSNSASKYLSKALDEGEKDPKQVAEEEKAKEQLEKEREERKAQMAKERSKREDKRQALRDKYKPELDKIQKKESEEDKSAIEDGIEVVQEQIEEIKKKSSCKCMWDVYFLSDKNNHKLFYP